MTIELLRDQLIAINGASQVLTKEPMKQHTSFRIGGPADLMVLPTTEEGLSKTMAAIHQMGIDCFIMGNGSNLLVSDAGYRGVIVKIADNFNAFTIEDDQVSVQAGMLLSTLSSSIMKAELTGFEFASGIPGTIGGAVFMNAGAYDGEFKDIVKWVRVMDMKGQIKEYPASMMDFAYRHSLLHETEEIVIACGLALKKGNYIAIKEKTDDLTLKRTTKQPLQLPSAGSTFKRPEGYFAGKLIDDAGLRGLKLGGAQVSILHCGFVVNVDNATCEDVLNLIGTIQKVVYDRFNVALETEVRFLGEF